MFVRKKRPSCCFVPGCNSGYKLTNRQNQTNGKRNPALFSVKNQEDLVLWSKAIQRTDKKLELGDRVCELHFTEDCIIRHYETVLRDGTVWRLERSRYVLKDGSVPTIFPHPCIFSKRITSKKYLNKKNNSKTRKISSNEASECGDVTFSVTPEFRDATTSETPECRIVTSSEIPKFKAVALNKIPESRIVISSEIPEFKAVKLNKNPECRVVIENNIPESRAVATNKIPECRSVKSNDNPECKDVTSIEYPKCREVFSNMSDDDIPESAEIDINENSRSAKIVANEIIETFSYNRLVSNLELISKPDSLWGISIHDKFVMCAKWDEDNALMKRVVIDYNLKIHVFFKSRAIDFDNVKINSVNDLSLLLSEVDRCGICIHADNRENSDCDGYILPNTLTNMCEYCLLIGNWEINRNRRKDLYWLTKGRNFTKNQALYDKICTLNKKNMLLKEQLNKIIKIKAIWKESKQTNENPVKI